MGTDMQQTKRLLKGFNSTISGLNLIIAYALAVVMLLFGGIMLYEAIARHFFDSPTTWAFEFSKMAFGFYLYFEYSCY